jgi:cell division protein FtsB
MTKPSARRRAWFIAGASCTPFLAALPAWSQEDLASQLKALQAQVETQTHELEVERQSLQAQGQLLHDQAAEIEALKAQASGTSGATEPSEALTTFRGRGLDPQALGAGWALAACGSELPAPRA